MLEALFIDDDIDETRREAMVVSLAYRQITPHICSTFPEACAFLTQHTPHLIVLDLVIHDPETGERNYYKPFGVRAAHLLSRQYPRIPLLIYTAHAQHFGELQALLDAHPAGAGFLHKGDGVPALIDAMRAVSGGNTVYSREAQSAARPPLSLSPSSSSNFDPEQLEQVKKFTPSELETCKYAADGLSNSQIAARRGVTAHTVYKNFTNMYKKLDVNGEGNGENSAVNLRLLLALYHYLRDRNELPPH